MNTGSNPAVKCPVRNLSPDVAKIVQNQIKIWLDTGIIVPVCSKGSDWNAWVLVVAKKLIPGQPQQYRICIDYRHLNPIPFRAGSLWPRPP